MYDIKSLLPWRVNTWEQSMDTWLGILSRAHHSDKSVSRQGINDLEAKKREILTGTGCNYYKRKVRFVAYAREYIRASYPDVYAQTLDSAVNWAIGHYPLVIGEDCTIGDEPATEQMLVETESRIIRHMCKNKLSSPT